jgi:hypothetical protein
MDILYYIRPVGTHFILLYESYNRKYKRMQGFGNATQNFIDIAKFFIFHLCEQYVFYSIFFKEQNVTIG